MLDPTKWHEGIRRTRDPRPGRATVPSLVISSRLRITVAPYLISQRCPLRNRDNTIFDIQHGSSRGPNDGESDAPSLQGNHREMDQARPTAKRSISSLIQTFERPSAVSTEDLSFPIGRLGYGLLASTCRASTEDPRHTRRPGLDRLRSGPGSAAGTSAITRDRPVPGANGSAETPTHRSRGATRRGHPRWPVVSISSTSSTALNSMTLSAPMYSGPRTALRRIESGSGYNRPDSSSDSGHTPPLSAHAAAGLGAVVRRDRAGGMISRTLVHSLNSLHGMTTRRVGHGGRVTARRPHRVSVGNGASDVCPSSP